MRGSLQQSCLIFISYPAAALASSLAMKACCHICSSPFRGRAPDHKTMQSFPTAKAFDKVQNSVKLDVYPYVNVEDNFARYRYTAL